MAEVFELHEYYEPLGKAELVDHDDRTLRFRAGTTTVEVTALAPDLFRVGMFLEGRPARYTSEAIYKEDWEPAEISMEKSDGEISISTPAASGRVVLDPLRISFADASGREIAVDDPELGMGHAFREESVFDAPLGDPVRVYKKRFAGERYFGCGERTGGIEKSETYLNFWNTDPPEGHTDSHDSLYNSIPLTLVMRRGQAWGIFLDSTYRSVFDLGYEDPQRAGFGANGGDLIYYVFCGPAPRDVIARYTELTGRTQMPPMWTLGHHQSRWSYMSEEEIRELAINFREKDIPCDVIHFDIDYMDGYRVFTWDNERFPNPEKLISDLKDQGFNVVTIVDPGVKVDEDYPIYTEGRDKDLFCKTFTEEEYHNVVWPGMCAFPDFTNTKVRDWWGEKHQVLTDIGVAGIWCDMNEPALFIPKQSTMPDDVVHPGDGHPKVHAQVHNAYGSLMARAVRNGLLKLRPDKRPFVITRAGYAGLQRHAMQWTGDNSSWWEHLQMSMPQIQNLGLSGVAWVGVDVGGFFDDSNGELMARWYEFGIFQPFCRNHAAKGTRPQEPWAFGEPYESVARKMIKLRMRLLPYLYTLFDECHRTGAPIMRPLLFEYPEDEAGYTHDEQLLLGESLLVAPVVSPGIDHRHVYLPEDVWFHYWSGERFDGPAHILAYAPLGEPPTYVKANTAVPLGPEMNHTGELPADPLTFLIYPAEGYGRSDFYEDAGEGYGYEEGEYARREISCETSSGRITVTIGEREGSFVPGREQVLLELRGVDNPENVQVDGEAADWHRDEESGSLMVSLGEKEASSTIEVVL
ncbi:MAG: glycoside hydrolase family 31 protein [Rubrobacteraceae bacterium]